MAAWAQPHPSPQRGREWGDDGGCGTRPAGRHEHGARRIRRMGRARGTLSARDRGSAPLEGPWRPMADDPQRCPVGARRRHALKQAGASEVPDIASIAPYAGFGAFYFLVSALWLTVSDVRRRRAAAIGN